MLICNFGLIAVSARKGTKTSFPIVTKQKLRTSRVSQWSRGYSRFGGPSSWKRADRACTSLYEKDSMQGNVFLLSYTKRIKELYCAQCKEVVDRCLITKCRVS